MKWQIGDVTVTKIVELETTGGSRFILPQATREAILPISWLIPHFADEEGRLKMSIHALIVEAPGRRIIVDTCLGNDKKDRRIPTWNDRQGRFLEDLAAAGFARETIDTVLCTHLHVDHVGWNTMLVEGHWVPTFPKSALPVRSRGVRALEHADGACRHASCLCRQHPSGFRPWSRRSGRVGPPNLSRDPAYAEHGPHARPRQRPDHLERQTSYDHGRLRPSSLPDGTS